MEISAFRIARINHVKLKGLEMHFVVLHDPQESGGYNHHFRRKLKIR
jgi:hypothetical protein